jgi:hypothetical protein
MLMYAIPKRNRNMASQVENIIKSKKYLGTFSCYIYKYSLKAMNDQYLHLILLGVYLHLA